YLGQTLAQTIQLAQDEYINAFSVRGWRQAVRSSFAGQSPEPEDDKDGVQDDIRNPRERQIAETVEALNSRDDRTVLRALESTLSRKWPSSQSAHPEGSSR